MLVYAFEEYVWLSALIFLPNLTFPAVYSGDFPHQEASLRMHVCVYVFSVAPPLIVCVCVCLSLQL